jgi:acetoacetyl-CoA synthetase
MPSMPVRFWNDLGDKRYRAAYFDTWPCVWRHGYWIQFTARGSAVISGRSDATLNRGGVRLGTSEFYTVVEEFDEIRDSVVVHLEDDRGGAGELLLFVVLHNEFELDDDLRGRLRSALRSQLSPRRTRTPSSPYPRSHELSPARNWKPRSNRSCADGVPPT